MPIDQDPGASFAQDIASRKIVNEMDESSGDSAEMPKYRCHKEVRALKIAKVTQAPMGQERVNEGGDWYIHPEDKQYFPILVGHSFVMKHKPEAGGYFVVYADGYKSFSPAKAFEDGYTRI